MRHATAPGPGDTLLCVDAAPGLTAGRSYTVLADGLLRHDDGAARGAEMARMLLVAPAGAPPPGRYRHTKGGLYRVLGVGRHSETEEWLVTYWSEATRDVWVRPLALWLEPANGAARFAPAPEG